MDFEDARNFKPVLVFPDKDNKLPRIKRQINGFFRAEATSLKSRILTFVKFVFFLGLGIFIIWLSLKDLTQDERHNIIESFKIANYYWWFLQ